MTARLNLITAPTGEPLTLDQAKLFCRCGHDAENELFGHWIASARQYVEQIISRQLLPATWRLTMPGFPPLDVTSPIEPCQSGIVLRMDNEEIDLPITPVTSAVISYYDIDNVQQTWAAENWQLTGDEAAASITRASTVNWPATYQRDDAVQVDFQAGYGATAIPRNFFLAMYFHIQAAYQRTPANEAALNAIESLLELKTTRRYR